LSSFFDQVADKFYQQVIYIENYDTSSTNLLDASTVEANRNNSKFSFYNTQDLLANNVNGKLAHLVFYTGTAKSAIINQTVPTNTDPHYGKTLPVKTYYENSYLIFHIDHMK
jgi:hypothetical protein